MTLLVLAVPLDLAGGDAGLPLHQRTEAQLPHRQPRQALVAEHADIHLASIDILLDQGVGADLIVDEGDTVAQLLRILDDGGLRDAERRVLSGRLHEQGITQPGRHSELDTTAQHRELRRRDAMVSEQLLAQRLIARQQQAARIATGIGLLHEFEEGHDMLVVGDDPIEFLEQVEDDIGSPFSDGGAQLREAVEHAEAAHLMTHRTQGRDDIELGAPVVDLLVGEARRALGGYQRRMDEDQDPERLHSVNPSRPPARAARANRHKLRAAAARPARGVPRNHSRRSWQRSMTTPTN